jgi:TPR repeat protein
LGLCYAKGEGVVKNEAEAVEWYRRAAEQNQVQAQFNLGFCYAYGHGVEKDEAEAVKWYRKVAEAGEVKAFNALAWMLATTENSAVRDGFTAVGFAEKAVAATNRKSPAELDTLAAAYAETSQFEKAVSTQQEAIALLQTEAEKNDYRTRLKLFELHLPYRAKE